MAREIHACVDAGLDPNLEILTAKLKERKVLDEIGGQNYVEQVAEYVPSPSKIRDYASIVLDNAVKRSLEYRCRDLIGTIHSGDAEVSDILAEAFKMGRNLPQIGTDTVMSSEVDVEALATRHAGILTPWPTLNMACRGSGFYYGETTIIIGHRGTGKTGILVQAMIEAWKAGKKPFYATLEMTAEEIVLRQVQSLCGFTRPPSTTENWALWDDAVKFVKKMNIPIYDPRKMIGGDRSVDKFCSWAEDAVSNLGCDCGFLDYAQKLTGKGKSENRTREMDYCADRIDDLVKTTGLSLPVGSQRSVDAHNKNDWRSKDSIKWEDNAGLVLQIRRPPNETVGKLFCSKNRHGEEPVIPVHFIGPKVRHVEDDPFAEI